MSCYEGFGKAVVAINALHVNACPQIKASPLL
jgi:hypothetical protein